MGREAGPKVKQTMPALTLELTHCVDLSRIKLSHNLQFALLYSGHMHGTCIYSEGRMSQVKYLVHHRSEMRALIISLLWDC